MSMDDGAWSMSENLLVGGCWCVETIETEAVALFVDHLGAAGVNVVRSTPRPGWAGPRAWGGGVVRLALDPRVKFVRTPSQEEKLAQALSRYYGETVRLEISTATGEIDTPARAEVRASQQELESARQSMETDPAVQGLRERFGATLLSDTVRPIK